MIEKGRYVARADGHQFGRAKTGTPHIRVFFQILKPEESAGYRVYWDGWLTDKTIERTTESLEACGWDCKSLTDMSGLGTKDCELVIEHEHDDEGNTYVKVQWVNRLGGGRIKEEQELRPEEVRALDREFKATMLERQQGRRSSPQPSRSGAPQSPGGGFARRPPAQGNGGFEPPPQDFGPMPDDDDIPF